MQGGPEVAFELTIQAVRGVKEHFTGQDARIVDRQEGTHLGDVDFIQGGERRHFDEGRGLISVKGVLQGHD